MKVNRYENLELTAPIFVLIPLFSTRLLNPGVLSVSIMLIILIIFIVVIIVISVAHIFHIHLFVLITMTAATR
ncbi:hypothetical protein V8C42DRAFT_305983 [Trichoderma barbatum]